jgi:hypothetical protein
VAAAGWRTGLAGRTAGLRAGAVLSGRQPRAGHRQANRKIANQLDVTIRTVDAHVGRILR